MSTPATLTFKRRIPGPPDEVFDAWTQPDVIRLWLAPGDNRVIEATTDVRVGGNFRIRSIAPDGSLHTIDGTYRELDPPRRIVMTWSYSGPVELLCEMETLLEVDLSANGDETAMTVTQTRIASPEAAEAYGEGWPTCFDKLERSVGATKRQ
jgi:uncharacterized protein YndB with AHSA1/START domain